jgi:mevalonate kinase
VLIVNNSTLGAKMIINSSAPGKLILLGEHASSRLKPALVFAVNMRIQAELRPLENKNGHILLTSERYNVYREPFPNTKLGLVNTVITTFFREMNVVKKPCEIIIHSNIQPGFGSSAGVIAAILGVLDRYHHTNLTKKQLLDIGLKANFEVKGYGSGLDIGAAIYGGLIKYQKGQEPINLPCTNLSFIVGNTGIKAPSGPIVKKVKELESKQPKRTKKIFQRIEEIVLEAEVAIQQADLACLGELMCENQELLRKLGVSSPTLEAMIQAAMEGGALGAKLSGAGIGDNMIALTENNDAARERVRRVINKTAGKALLETTIDTKGLVTKRE